MSALSNGRQILRVRINVGCDRGGTLLPGETAGAVKVPRVRI